MIGRSPKSLIGLILASLGVPYLASNGLPWLSQFTSSLTTATAEAPVDSGPQQSFVPEDLYPEIKELKKEPELAWALPQAPMVEAPVVVPMAEALNFQITPAAITQRWPRVTTGLADAEHHGYRVTWISGTSAEELAGALTYYFTSSQQLARIQFRGTTGDPRKLVGLVTGQFELQPRNTGDPSVQVYQARWNGQAYSELTIRPAGSLRSTDRYANFQVELVLTNRNAR